VLFTEMRGLHLYTLELVDGTFEAEDTTLLENL
jgi:hypothetical protein